MGLFCYFSPRLFGRYRRPSEISLRSNVAWTGSELSSLCEKTRTRYEIHFEPDAVRILEKHVVVTGRPRAFHRAANDQALDELFLGNPAALFLNLGLHDAHDGGPAVSPR